MVRTRFQPGVSLKAILESNDHIGFSNALHPMDLSGLIDSISRTTSTSLRQAHLDREPFGHWRWM